MVFPLGPDRRDALSYVGGGAARHVGLASRLPNHKNRVEMHPPCGGCSEFKVQSSTVQSSEFPCCPNPGSTESRSTKSVFPKNKKTQSSPLLP